MSSLLLVVPAVVAPGVAAAQDDDGFGMDDDDDVGLDDDDSGAVALDDDDDDDDAGAANAGGGVTADDAGTLRVSPYFLLGFGGGVDVGIGTVDLKASIGFGGRVDYAIHDYVTVGGQLTWASMKIDAPGADRDNELDISPFVRGRYVLDVGGKPLEAYALIPVGFSVYLPSASGADSEMGWNLGLLFGATYYVTPSIGVFAELGFMHQGFDSADINQGRLHLGAVFAL